MDGTTIAALGGALSALAGLVVLFVKWMMARADRDRANELAAAERDRADMVDRIANLEARNTQLETKVETLTTEIRTVISRKHQAENDTAGAVGVLKVIRHLATQLDAEHFYTSVPALLADLDVLHGGRRGVQVAVEAV